MGSVDQQLRQPRTTAEGPYGSCGQCVCPNPRAFRLESVPSGGGRDHIELHDRVRAVTRLVGAERSGVLLELLGRYQQCRLERSGVIDDEMVGYLGPCQFPDPVRAANGRMIAKPAGW